MVNIITNIISLVSTLIIMISLEWRLTLLGVTRKVTAQAALSGKQGDLLGLEAETVIKRSDFGSKYGIPMLGDEVRIYVAVEGGKK